MANLDVTSRDALLSSIETLAEKFGAGIVYISHKTDVIDRCDECVKLRNRLRESVEEKEAA